MKIRAVVVRAGQEPKTEEIDDSLENYQEIVGGYIESHTVGENIVLVCNEDGIRLNLPQNGCGILGNYFFCKVDDNGDYASLNEQECSHLMVQVVARRSIKHNRQGISVKFFDSNEELFKEMENLRNTQDLN